MYTGPMPRGLRRSFIAFLVVTGIAALALWSGRRARTVPNPNGYDRLAALAATLPETVRDLADTNASAAAAEQFVKGHSNLVSEVIDASASPCLVPLKYSAADLGTAMVNGMGFRRLEKALLVCASAADASGDPQGATRARLASVELGQQCSRGGLLVHFMIGSAIQMYGLTQISNSIGNLDPALCLATARGLAGLRQRQERFREIVRRERRWIWSGSEWWKDWRSAISVPGALISTGRQMSLAGVPARRFEDLERSYRGTEEALRKRGQEAGR